MSTKTYGFRGVLIPSTVAMMCELDFPDSCFVSGGGRHPFSWILVYVHLILTLNLSDV